MRMIATTYTASRYGPALLVIALTLGCHVQPTNVGLDSSRTTGLEGTVLRGPVQPVCRIHEPCDAPFSGTFGVWQRQKLVARFRSDSAGRYEVPLPPGTYAIVADPGAPVWPPGQAHDVTVGPVGLTHVDLSFDTGIR